MKLSRVQIKISKSLHMKHEEGFTFIELISITVVMGVMVSVVMKKTDFLSDNASLTLLRSGIRELNTRETVVWSKMKLSDAGYSNDSDVYNAIDKNVGAEYSWHPAPNKDGGRLHFGSQSIDLTRVPSTSIAPGSWE